MLESRTGKVGLAGVTGLLSVARTEKGLSTVVDTGKLNIKPSD